MNRSRGGEGHYREGVAQGGLFGPPEAPVPPSTKRPRETRAQQQARIDEDLGLTAHRAADEARRAKGFHISPDTDDRPDDPQPPKPRIERRWDGDTDDVVLNS